MNVDVDPALEGASGDDGLQDWIARGVLQREVRELVVIAPTAPPKDLAQVLIDAARRPHAMALDTLDRWWATAAAGARTRLVLMLARALNRVDSATAQRLNDPRWRNAVGIPLWLATFVNVRRRRRRSRAQNTLRGWNTDWRIWRRWCKQHQRPSFNPSAEQLDAFLRDFAPKRKRATTQRWGASLTAMHAAAGLPNPLDNPISREVWLAHSAPSATTEEGLALQQRDADDRRRLPRKQAYGLTRDLLERTMARCDEDTSLRGVRDAALLAIAYDMLARRSEISSEALLVSDISKPKADGSGSVLIRRSKTDQQAKGVRKYLRLETMVRLRQWIERAELEEGPLFRSLRGFSGQSAVGIRRAPALQAADVLRIMRRRVTAVDAEIGPFVSGHSARVGGAQDLQAAGIPDNEIAAAGRWKSVAQVILYTSEQSEERGGMATLARMQREEREMRRDEVTSGVGSADDRLVLDMAPGSRLRAFQDLDLLPIFRTSLI